MTLTRNIEAVGIRFRLLSSILDMIQSDSSSNGLSKSVLRQRVYSTAFDFFTLSPQTPTQSLTQLKSDLKQLIIFWKTLYADTKYIKKEFFLCNDLELNLATAHPMLANGNFAETNQRPPQTWHGSASSPVNAWANTIPIVAAQSRSGASQVRSRPADQVNRDIDRQVRNCLRRRQLLLLLVANEIERLEAWLYPLGDHVDEEKINVEKWLKTTFGETRSDVKQMRDLTKFAWEISTQLAVCLDSRFRAHSTVRNTLQDLVRMNPEQVSHMSEALSLFLGDGNPNYDTFDVSLILILIVKLCILD